MELKDFVSNTLVQIVEGICDAQKKVSHLHECKISPAHTPGSANSDSCHITDVPGADSLECVNFNIAISTSASGNLDGKAKIIVVNAELGGTISRENISRVSFPVYVQWPRKS